MNMQASLLTVTREVVPEDRRMDVVEGLFGVAFPLQLEPVVYGITDRMAGVQIMISAAATRPRPFALGRRV